MKKGLVFVFVLLMQALGAIGQNIDLDVELILNSTEPYNVPVNDSPCTIKMRAYRYGNSIELSAELENNDEERCMMLFGRSFTEKELKRRKIKFDKVRYGKFNRNISPCSGVDDDVFEIAPGQTGRMEVSHVSGSSYKWAITLYIAKQKKRKRIIMTKRELVLHVTLKDEEKNYGDYNAISSRCDDIIAEIEQVTICPGRNHGLTMDEQKAPYLERIEEVRQEIEQVKAENHWRDTDGNYQRYKELLSRLDAVDFREALCSRCKGGPIPPPHRCDYCDKTPEEILQQMVVIYQRLDTRSIDKERAKQLATRLRNLWSGGCPRLKQKMRNTGSTERKVESYYNSICNY